MADRLNIKDSIKIFVQGPKDDIIPDNKVSDMSSDPCDECGIVKSCNEETKKRCCVKCVYDNLNADCDNCIAKKD